MTRTRKRSRAQWIAILFALGAICALVVVGVREGTRFVRESRAIAGLQLKEGGERRAALRELAALRSARGVAALLSAMPSERKLERAVEILNGRDGDSWEGFCALKVREIGRAAVPVLGSKLGSPDSVERFWSVVFLLQGPESVLDELAPRFLPLLDDSDQSVRELARFPVGLSASKNPRLLDTLVSNLKRTDSSENLRVAAAQAIQVAAVPAVTRERLRLDEDKAPHEATLPSPEMTAAMRSAALALQESAEDSSDPLWEESLDALVTIRDRWSFNDLDVNGSFQTLLRRGLKHEDATRRSLALEYLGDAFDLYTENPSLPPDVLRILGKLLLDENEAVRDGAREYLMPEIVPVLLEILAREDPELATRVLMLVRRLESEEGRPPEVQR